LVLPIKNLNLISFYLFYINLNFLLPLPLTQINPSLIINHHFLPYFLISFLNPNIHLLIINLPKLLLNSITLSKLSLVHLISIPTIFLNLFPSPNSISSPSLNYSLNFSPSLLISLSPIYIYLLSPLLLTSSIKSSLFPTLYLTKNNPH
jgi:hypothetical protein